MTVYLSDLTVGELEELVVSLGEPSYRARQLLTRVYRRLADSFDEMTDLPASFRRKLAERISLRAITRLHDMVSRDGTVKALFRLGDNRTVEAALMSYAAGAGSPRTTICVSSQVGCAIGCTFCATGQQGLERNLTAGEIIDQVLYFARRLQKTSGRVNNLVFMGMGEPLANYGAVWQAIETLNSPLAFGFGARNITISTAGFVPQIERLARERLQVGLAVSLHASTNALRDRLVPLNRRYPLEKLIPACQEYYRRTGRRVSFEYVLFAGINDTLAEARSLAELLAGLNCHVNLIPANSTTGNDWRPPSREAVLEFEWELRKLGINCTLRVSRGQDIDAGCGQLRSRFPV